MTNTKGPEDQNPTNIMGVYHYSSFPQGMRLATASDLFNDTAWPFETWVPKPGRWYLIESFLNPGTYQAYRTSEITTFTALRPWYAYQKIWVRNEE